MEKMNPLFHKKKEMENILVVNCEAFKIFILIQKKPKWKQDIWTRKNIRDNLSYGII
jgi:hypothetical protein